MHSNLIWCSIMSFLCVKSNQLENDIVCKHLSTEVSTDPRHSSPGRAWAQVTASISFRVLHVFPHLHVIPLGYLLSSNIKKKNPDRRRFCDLKLPPGANVYAWFLVIDRLPVSVPNVFKDRPWIHLLSLTRIKHLLKMNEYIYLLQGDFLNFLAEADLVTIPWSIISLSKWINDRLLITLFVFSESLFQHH